MFDLTGRVAVVTGGSSGLGVLFGHALAKQGATVVLLARREEKLQKVAADIMEQHGTKAGYYVCDVTDSKRVAEVAELVVADFGKIDILFVGLFKMFFVLHTRKRVFCTGHFIVEKELY